MNKLNDVMNYLNVEMTKLEKEIEDANIPELKKRLDKAQNQIDELSMMTSDLEMAKDHIDSLKPTEELEHNHPLRTND